MEYGYWFIFKPIIGLFSDQLLVYFDTNYWFILKPSIGLSFTASIGLFLKELLVYFYYFSMVCVAWYMLLMNGCYIEQWHIIYPL